MTKVYCIRLVTGTVAILGLVSCAKDKQPASGRRVFEAPMIVRQGVRFSLEDWKADRGSLPLDATIDVNDAVPTTEVSVNCPEGNVTHHLRTRFDNVASIPMFKVLPETLLTRDLGESQVACHFVVELKSKSKISDGFTFTGTPSTSSFGTLAMPTPGGVDGNYRRYRVNTLQDVTLPAQLGSSRARLICKTGKFATQTIEKNQVRLASLFVHEQNDAAVAGSPDPGDQLCRVVFYGDRDERREVTPLLMMRFANDAFKVHTQLLPDVVARTLPDGLQLPLAAYEVENLENRPIRIRFNKDWIRTRLRINPIWDANGVGVTEKPWSRIFVINPTGVDPVAQNEEFEIAPHGRQQFELRYRSGGSLACDHLRVRVQVVEPVLLHEVDAHHNVITSIKLEMPPEYTKTQWESLYNFDEKLEHPVNCFYR